MKGGAHSGSVVMNALLGVSRRTLIQSTICKLNWIVRRTCEGGIICNLGPI